MIKNISVSEIAEGMVLARSLTNRFGQVLLIAGTELSKQHINIFKIWGIEFVTIETGGGENENILADPKVVEKANERLKLRLLWEPEIPEEMELISIGLKRAAELHLRKAMQ